MAKLLRRCPTPGCETMTRVAHCPAHTVCVVEACGNRTAHAGRRCRVCWAKEKLARKRATRAAKRAAKGQPPAAPNHRAFNRVGQPPVPMRAAGAGVASFQEAQDALHQATAAPVAPSPPYWMLDSPSGGPTSSGYCKLCGADSDDFPNVGPFLWEREDVKAGVGV